MPILDGGSVSPDTDLLTGIAGALHADGAGMYRDPASNQPYQPGETAIVFGKMPATPDRAVVLALYGPSDDHPNQALGVRRLQVRVRGVRGDYLDSVSLLNDCFNALHGLTHQQWGTAHADQVLRLTGGPLGWDESNRHEFADNYQVDLDVPTTALRPY